MHNNGPINVARDKKESYTVVEAAVQLARADGAKTSNDPRINLFTTALLEALSSGALRGGAGIETLPSASPSSRITVQDLRQWLSNQFPRLKPSFLYGKND